MRRLGQVPKIVRLLVVGISAIAAGSGASMFVIEFAGSRSTAAGVGAEPATPIVGRPATDPVKCKQIMSQFGDYPLVWLGNQFEGLPLVGCERVATAATSYGTLATDYFFVYYGDCPPVPGSENGSCAVPLQVSVQPACAPPVVDRAKRRRYTVRGAAAAELFNGSVQVEAAQFRVLISSGRDDQQGRDQVMRAAAKLEGGNALASRLTLDAPLNDESKVLPGSKQVC